MEGCWVNPIHKIESLSDTTQSIFVKGTFESGENAGEISSEWKSGMSPKRMI
jgi:hypothetical protein